VKPTLTLLRVTICESKLFSSSLTSLSLGMTIQVGLTHLGLVRIRPAQRGLIRPTPHTLCGLQTLVHPDPQADPLFFFFKFL